MSSTTVFAWRPQRSQVFAHNITVSLDVKIAFYLLACCRAESAITLKNRIVRSLANPDTNKSKFCHCPGLSYKPIDRPYAILVINNIAHCFLKILQLNQWLLQKSHKKEVKCILPSLAAALIASRVLSISNRASDASFTWSRRTSGCKSVIVFASSAVIVRSARADKIP